MNLRAIAVLPFLLAGAFATTTPDSGRGPGVGTPRRAPVPARTRGIPGVPVHFEANRGQAARGVDFVARAPGVAGFLSKEGAVLAVGRLPRPAGGELLAGEREEGRPETASVRMTFEGSGEGAVAAPGPLLPGRSHYLRGPAAAWVRDVPQHADAAYRGVWPGVDVQWRRSDRNRLRYDFLVSPGADPGRIALRFTGASSLGLDGEGNLVVGTGLGPMVHRAPRAWQDFDGKRRAVACAFRLGGDGLVGFDLGPVSPARALTIDPEIVYVSYMYAVVGDLAVDGDGNVLLCGSIFENESMQVVNAYQSVNKGETDGYVVKLDPAGTTVAYATYIGGFYAGSAQAAGDDYLVGITVDGTGRAVVVGDSNSNNYPTTTGSFQPTRSGAGSTSNKDVIATMFEADGSGLKWSSYLGGSGGDFGYDALIDLDGNVVLEGRADSGFPLKDAAQSTHGGNEDTFVTVVKADGSAILRSTYLGGTLNDRCVRIVCDGQGRLCILGTTGSSNLPVVNPYQATLKGVSDAFVARMAADGKSFEFVTYLGGGAYDGAGDLRIGPGGEWILVGTTGSTDFPQADPLQSYGGGSYDAWIAVFDADMENLEFSTFLGGSGYDGATGVSVDPAGGILVAGVTTSSGFPLVDEEDGTLENGKSEAFLTALSQDRTSLTWSTFLGGGGADAVVRMEDGPDLDVWAVLTTEAGSLPAEGGFLESGEYGGFLRVDMPELFTGPPAGILAALDSLTSLDVTWSDPGDLETGYRIQWKVGEGAWADLAVLAADVHSLHVQDLEPGETYSFRVAAFNDLAESPFTTPVSVTVPATPVLPPLAPSSLSAVATAGGSVDLSWNDNSPDESYFLVVRSEVEGGPYETLATPGINRTSMTDEGVLPDRTYHYRVSAANFIGPSGWSNTASATTPATITPLLSKGTIVDSPKPGKDKVTLAMIVEPVGGGGSFHDPIEEGFVLRIGGSGSPTLLQIPPSDPGWKVRKGKGTFKSAKEFVTKSKVVFDTTTGEIKVKITRMDLAVPVASPLRLSVSMGGEAGGAGEAWREKKPGVLQYP